MSDYNYSKLWQPYEWELLASPINITKNFNLDNFHYEGVDISLEGLTKIEISRDEHYNIIVAGQGAYNGHNENTKTQTPPGTLLGDSRLAGSDDQENTIILDSCYIKTETTHSKFSPGHDGHKTDFEVDIHAFQVTHQKYGYDGEYDALCEWYINAPSSTFMYCDGTSKETTIDTFWKREHITVHPPQLTRSKRARNTLYIQYNDTAFYLTKVDSSYLPTWSEKIGIEYHQKFGRIPEQEERHAIAELIGFLVGKNIALVGSTCYNNGAVVEAMSCNPVLFNIIKECTCSNHEIVPVHQPYAVRNNLRVFLEAFLPKYLSLRQEYMLNEIMGKYWLAYSLPIGADIPILSSALETIMSVWFKSSQSPSQASYLPKEEYQQRIAPILQEVTDIFQDNLYKGRILNKISNAYMMGPNEKFHIFFEELGMEIGECENEAFKARNEISHGKSLQVKDTSEFTRLLKKSETFRLLVARVVLKLLDYDKEYIDFSVIGFPRKNINEPIG